MDLSFLGFFPCFFIPSPHGPVEARVVVADHFFVVAASQRNAFADPSMELICSEDVPCRGGGWWGIAIFFAMEKWKELEVKHQTCDF